MSSTHRASTHTHRGDQKHARAQSLLYLTFLGLSSLFTIFGSSKGVNPNLHLIMAFLGKISAHCDKPHFLPSRPQEPHTTPDSRSTQKSQDWVASNACTPQAPQHQSQHVMWLMMMLHWQAGPLKPARSALEDARAKRALSSSIYIYIIIQVC